MGISTIKFKLLHKEKDSKFNIDDLEHYNLLLQVGFSDLQLCIADSRENRILLLEDYIMPGIASNSERVECLEHLFDDHHLLLAGFWKNVRILVKNKKFSIIPNELFVKENARDFIRLNAAIDEDDKVFFNVYNSLNLVNSFCVNNGVYDFIHTTYANTRVNFYHQSSAFINGHNRQFISRNQVLVCLYIDRFVLHITVLGTSGLRFYNQYTIKKFEDYFRFIGYVVQELKLDIKKVPFYIWGYLGAKSSHFNSLKAKFPTLQLGGRPTDLKMSYHFDEIPDHQYFDLLSLNQFS